MKSKPITWAVLALTTVPIIVFAAGYLSVVAPYWRTFWNYFRHLL